MSRIAGWVVATAIWRWVPMGEAAWEEMGAESENRAEGWRVRVEKRVRWVSCEVEVKARESKG